MQYACVHTVTVRIIADAYIHVYSYIQAYIHMHTCVYIGTQKLISCMHICSCIYIKAIRCTYVHIGMVHGQFKW